MCKFIDRKLDLITTFPKSPELQGAKLEWFNNGGFRDIRLSYKGRVVKIFLVVNPDKVNVDTIIHEASKILNKSFFIVET
jgi:hypothetical protein